MSVMAALMWRMGGFGPMPNPSSPSLRVKDEADRRYGIDQRLGQSIADLVP
jgi:hypothetical protein